MENQHINTGIPDAMPREVAIGFLTNPKAKISNTFRKVCLAAIASVTPSTQTFVRKFADADDTQGWLEPDGRQPIDDATKLSRRLQRVPLDRLQRIITRCNIRARQVARAIQKARTDYVRDSLAQVFARLHAADQAANAEIFRRTEERRPTTRRHPLWNRGVQ